MKLLQVISAHGDQTGTFIITTFQFHHQRTAMPLKGISESATFSDYIIAQSLLFPWPK